MSVISKIRAWQTEWQGNYYNSLMHACLGLTNIQTYKQTKKQKKHQHCLSKKISKLTTSLKSTSWLIRPATTSMRSWDLHLVMVINTILYHAKFLMALVVVMAPMTCPTLILWTACEKWPFFFPSLHIWILGANIFGQRKKIIVPYSHNISWKMHKCFIVT